MVLFIAALVLPTLLSANMNMGNTADDKFECMVQNVYHEARGELVQGQIAVMDVVMNRVDSGKYPDTVCAVVWERRQFSWTSDGRSDDMRNSPAVYWINLLVNYYFMFGSVDITRGAVMYHAKEITPYWASSYTKTLHLGNHIFYKEK